VGVAVWSTGTVARSDAERRQLDLAMRMVILVEADRAEADRGGYQFIPRAPEAVATAHVLKAAGADLGERLGPYYTGDGTEASQLHTMWPRSQLWDAMRDDATALVEQKGRAERAS
jgi:hypothetical protein